MSPERWFHAERLLATPRSWLAWSMAHGVQRGLIRRGARRGDLLSRLVIDPALAGDPFAAYERLRSQGPIVSNGLMRASVDHAVCNQVLRSDAFGTQGGHGELPGPMRWLHDRVVDPNALSPVDPPALLAVDPPDHTRYRRLVSRAFTARRVGTMADRVAEVARRLLDDLDAEQAATRDAGTAQSPSFDLVDRYASRLPVAVIADLLGVAEADHDRLLALGNEAAITLDPGLTWAQYRRAEAALREMHAWFADHLDHLRREPGDDLISQLLALPAQEQLTEVELHQTGLLVLGAGFETTVNLIGNAVVLLDRHPDQLAWVLEDPERWAGAVEEVMRHASPVQLTLRSALRETEIAGTRFGAGEAILLYLGGANRDPQVFADPELFDVARPNAADHIGFSAGAHFCLGAGLARLEAVVALRELYARHPDLRVVGTPERRGTRVLRGFERIEVGGRSAVPA